MATFGDIGSAMPNVLFNPMAADQAAQKTVYNRLLMQNAQQDQAQDTYKRDAEARIGMARELSNLPEHQASAEWGTYRQRLQSAGLGHGLPEQFPGMDRIKAVAASDLTTFQRLQLEEKRRQTEAFGALLGGSAPAAGGAPAGGAPAGGGQAAASPPPEMMPHFQAASAQTGIPVPLLVAQAQQESGFNPNAVGRAGEVGVMQIMPSTARNPGFGMQGVDPATLRDPAANIAFGAQYLRARAGQGADLTNPQQRDQALRSYNGGGDPNYVQNVTRNLPQTDANGLTAQQRALAMAAGPERGMAMVAQFQQQNRMEADRVADRLRQDQRDAIQQQQQVVTNERADAAAKRADEAARRQDEAAARRLRLDEEKARQAADPSANATEAERKAAGFLERMQGVEQIADRITAPRERQGEGYDPSNIRDRLASGHPVVGNFLMTEPGQRYMNAAAEWTAAKLRFESGAAIGRDEATWEARTYFPMPGDSPAQIEQKRQLRETAMVAMRRNAGRALPTAPAAPAEGGNSRVDTVPNPMGGAPRSGERPPLSSFER